MIHLFGQTHQGFLDCRGKREFEFRKIYIAANKSVNRTVELLVSEYNRYYHSCLQIFCFVYLCSQDLSVSHPGIFVRIFVDYSDIDRIESNRQGKYLPQELLADDSNIFELL